MTGTTGPTGIAGVANIASATVATQQGVGSTTYIDMTTVGPSVTLTTGSSVIITLCAAGFHNGAGTTVYMGFAVSGATTVAPADAMAAYVSSPGVNFFTTISRTFLVTGLTPGVNTFTAKYRSSDTTTWTLGDRTITVIAP